MSTDDDTSRPRGRPLTGATPRCTRSVTLPADLWERIQARGRAGEPLSHVIERLLRRGLAR